MVRPCREKEHPLNQQSNGTGSTGRAEPPRLPAPAPYGTVTSAARQASELADRLRATLAAAGFEVDHDFPHLRGDTTASNEPFLTLGRLAPDVIELLLQRLCTCS